MRKEGGGIAFITKLIRDNIVFTFTVLLCLLIRI